MISASLLKIGQLGTVVASPIKTRKRHEKVRNDKCKPYQDRTARNDRCNPYHDQEEVRND